MNYHEAIIDLIEHILSKGEEYLNHLDSGNAYDKIIRNYHQFNVQGDKVYRSIKRGPKHYRYSEAAWKKRESKSALYYEHLYPVKLIKQELKNCDGTKSEINRILDKTEMVVLTKEEAKYVDQHYKDTVPEDGGNRLDAVGIKMSKHTLTNSLFHD